MTVAILVNPRGGRAGLKARGRASRLELGDPPPVGPLCDRCQRDRAQIELEPDSIPVPRRARYCGPCLEALVALGVRAMGGTGG